MKWAGVWAAALVVSALHLLVAASDGARLPQAAQILRHDNYPLKLESAGPRVCDAQWLLQAKKPSVYRSAYFRVRKEKSSCYYGVNTVKQVRLLRYRLGQPKTKITGRYTTDLKAILLGKKKRPSLWVQLATSRRTSGSVVYAHYPTSKVRSPIGFPFSGTHRLGNYQSDNAVDIPCEPGTPIFAPIKGRLFGGYGYLGLRGSRFAGQRINMTGLYKARAVNFYLAHLRTIVVRPFALVEAGQKVGTCGAANGIYHLHLGASYGFPIQSFVKELANPKLKVGGFMGASAPA